MTGKRRTNLASPAIQGQLRLLIVRHAQSANKEKEKGAKAEADPALTELGYSQAEALGQRLESEFSRKKGGLTVVSSPMRRCLLTILPAIRKLKLDKDACMVHGGCFEYACAGQAHHGREGSDITQEFPEFDTTGFNGRDQWDYRGNSPKENEAEAKARAARIKEWLYVTGAEMAQQRATSQDAQGPPTLVMCIHQTFADILCHELVEGSADSWKYGEVKNRLNNTSVTEVMIDAAEGQANFGIKNCDRHIFLMKARQAREAKH